MTKTPCAVLYRLAIGDSPWTPYLESKRKERFDDPNGKYWVLYASSSRLACFLECLQYYRTGNVPKLDEIKNVANDEIPAGSVPATWRSRHMLAEATVEGRFADIASFKFLSRLRTKVSQELLNSCGLETLDLAALFLTKPRTLTQSISNLVYEDSDASPPFDGIFYLSKLGRDLENWALFVDRAKISSRADSAPLSHEDADYLKACELIGIVP